MLKTTLSTTWRFRKSLMAIATLLFLSFLFVENASLQSFNSTTIALENANDQLAGSLEETTPSPSSSVSTSPKYPDTSSARNGTRILLVSAMFPLKKSKHSVDDYTYWLSKFLQPITTDVYFFTTPEFAPIVRQSRPTHLRITIDTAYSSPFDVPPLKGLQESYTKMHEKDRERRIHSPELYAVWNAKPFLLDSAVKTLAGGGESYDFAFWNDAGSFREDHKESAWPDAERVKQIWEKGAELTGTDAEDLIFFPLCGLPSSRTKNWKEEMGPVDYEVSEGSFFGGSPKAVAWWSQTFYAYHDYYLSLGHFVGKDQTLINALFLLLPSRIITVWYRDPNSPAHKGVIPYFDEGFLGACGVEWWYYQFWLSDRGVRDEMREAWVKMAKWAKWGWWRERQGCRLTGVEALEELLRRRFGRSWIPPIRKVVVPSVRS